MIEQISDVNVIVSIAKPSASVGLGIPAIFVKAATGVTASKMTKFEDLQTLAQSYDIKSDVYGLASAIFSQTDRPTHVDVIEYVDMAADGQKYFFEDWHFALLAAYNDADALVLSNLVEEQQFKFAVFQIESLDKLQDFGNNSRTIVYVHPLTLGRLDGAVIGNTANRVVGSTTWKFRHDLVGIQPNDEAAYADIIASKSKNTNMYITRAGVASTTEGLTQSGDFIDALHGDDYVRTSIVQALQNTLVQNDKIAYDTTGISVLRSQVELVLQTAYQNGIVEEDGDTGNGAYTVSADGRDKMTPKQILSREYSGLSFTYKRAHAIHTVTVHGTIVDGE